MVAVEGHDPSPGALDEGAGPPSTATRMLGEGLDLTRAGLPAMPDLASRPAVPPRLVRPWGLSFSSPRQRRAPGEGMSLSSCFRHLLGRQDPIPTLVPDTLPALECDHGALLLRQTL